MRTSLIAFTSIGLLAVALAACGGGSSNSTPSTPIVPASPAAQGVNGITATGPTSQMTVTLTLPKRTAPTAALHAAITQRFGAKSKYVRSFMNTSPTAAVRSYAAAMNQRAKAQESTRTPSYVSPATNYVELAIASGSTVQYDQLNECFVSGNTCSVTFTDIPIGTNYNAAIYLAQNDCGYITSAGAATNVTIAATNTPLPVTANPVVEFLDVSSTYQPVVGVTNAGFSVNVTPLDAEDYAVTAPGVLIDGSFDQINTITLTPPSGTDVAPATVSTFTVPTNLTGNAAYAFAQTYTSTGPVSQGQTQEWDAAEGTVGAQLVPNYNSNGTLFIYAPTPQNDAFTSTVAPKSIYIGVDPNQTVPTLFGLPYYSSPTPPPPGSSTTTSIEVAEPTPGPDLYLAVLGNYPMNGDAISLQQNNCADGEIQYNVNNDFPSPPPVNVTGTYFPFSVGTSGTAGATCTVSVYDSTQSLTATLNLQLDGADNVIINGKARK